MDRRVPITHKKRRFPNDIFGAVNMPTAMSAFLSCWGKPAFRLATPLLGIALIGHASPWEKSRRSARSAGWLRCIVGGSSDLPSMVVQENLFPTGQSEPEGSCRYDRELRNLCIGDLDFRQGC